MAGSSQVPHADLALVRRALAGEARAVEAVVERLRCVVRFLALRNERLGEPFGPSELEDIAQEVIIAAWSKLGLFEGRCSLEGWLQRFVQLELIYWLRKKDRRPDRLEDGWAGSQRAGEPFGADEAEVLYSALDKLDGDQADVIRLKHFEELTFQEIAQRLGLGANTAKTRYYRGLQRLRELLRPRRPGAKKAWR